MTSSGSCSKQNCHLRLDRRRQFCLYLLSQHNVEDLDICLVHSDTSHTSDTLDGAFYIVFHKPFTMGLIQHIRDAHSGNGAVVKHLTVQKVPDIVQICAVSKFQDVLHGKQGAVCAEISTVPSF